MPGPIRAPSLAGQEKGGEHVPPSTLKQYQATSPQHGKWTLQRGSPPSPPQKSTVPVLMRIKVAF